MSKKALPETYHHIYVKVEDTDVWSKLRNEFLNNKTTEDDGRMSRIPKMIKMMWQRTSAVLKHSTVQALMTSGQQFDVFFLDFNLNHPMLGLAGHFRIPSIIFSLSPAMKSLRDIIGNPASVATAPVFRESEISFHSTFRQRFGRFIGYMVEFCITTGVELFVQEKFYEEHFPAAKNFPTFDEVRKNVSLILVNSHFSEGIVRPHLPNLVEIGGIQIKSKPNPLPKVGVESTVV